MKPTVAVAAMTIMVAGCNGFAGLSADPCVDALDRPAKVLTQPDVGVVANGASNLGVHVSSTLEDPVRVTIRFGRKLALDVELPGTPAECSHQPVYKYSYRLPGGQATVTATTDRGQRRTTSVRLGAGRRWVVVQVQDGFPLQVEAWSSRPQWG